MSSVHRLVDGSGNAVESYSYGPYGQLLTGNPVGPTDNPYRWTGRRLDPETGLYYFRNRYYSPTIGRFLTEDPLGVWADRAHYGNPYAYAGNSPFIFYDALGLQTAVTPEQVWDFLCGESAGPSPFGEVLNGSQMDAPGLRDLYNRLNEVESMVTSTHPGIDDTSMAQVLLVYLRVSGTSSRVYYANGKCLDLHHYLGAYIVQRRLGVFGFGAGIVVGYAVEAAQAASGAMEFLLAQVGIDFPGVGASSQFDPFGEDNLSNIHGTGAAHVFGGFPGEYFSEFLIWDLLYTGNSSGWPWSLFRGAGGITRVR